MSKKNWQPPTSSTSHKTHLNTEQKSFSHTLQGESVNQRDGKNVAITADGSIFVKTLVQIDRKFMSTVFCNFQYLDIVFHS